MYSSTITQFEDPPKKDIKGLKDFKEYDSEPSILPCDEEGEQPLIWRNIIALAILHILAVYSFVTSYDQAKLGTYIFGEFHGFFACFVIYQTFLQLGYFLHAQ